MHRILMVEDEQRIRSFVVPYLQQAGYEVDEADCGEKGLELARQTKYALVLLDLMLPGIDGRAVCAELRKTSRVPVLMLTARAEETDILAGFECGADDYLTKPFSPRELLARIRALFSRAYPAAEDGALRSGPLALNAESQSALLDGAQMPLTPKEFDLLLVFCKNPGRLYTRDELLTEIWGYEYYGDTRTVDTHVKQLRDKLGAHREMLSTVWGKGYVWRAE
jgi:two-component system response regulator ResD